MAKRGGEDKRPKNFSSANGTAGDWLDNFCHNVEDWVDALWRRTGATICAGLALPGQFTPVLAKHSKNFSIVDSLAIGVDRIQRNFDPLRRQVETWRSSQITDDQAKLVIYRAFIEDHLDIPRHLARDVHKIYFEPNHQEFAPRTMWSLSNAFTSSLKSLDPIPFFRATAKLGTFLSNN